jgi:hypothetical protein
VFEIQRSSRFAEPGQIHAVGRLFQTVAGMIRAGQDRGELRDDLDPEIACYVLIGGLEIVITALVLEVIEIDEGGEAEGAYCEKVADTVIEVFFNGTSARSRP